MMSYDDDDNYDELARLYQVLDGLKKAKAMIFSGFKPDIMDLSVIEDMKKLRVRLQARMEATGTELQKLEPLGEKMAQVDKMIAEYSDLLN
jgi:hypothetical protein